jgi:hypothetical protein
MLLGAIELDAPLAERVARSDAAPPRLLSNLSFIDIPTGAGMGHSIELLGQQHGYRWGSLSDTGSLKPRQAARAAHLPACSEAHVPRPFWLSAGADPYAGSNTFCVVRDPYSRIIAEHALWMQANAATVNFTFECTPLGLNRYVVATLSTVAESVRRIGAEWPPNGTYPRSAPTAGAAAHYSTVLASRDVSDAAMGDCHLLPQWMFVDTANLSGACDHVLHYETLSTELADLFELYDPELVAESIADYMPPDAECQLESSALNAQATAFVDAVYASDFDRFQYSHARSWLDIANAQPASASYESNGYDDDSDDGARFLEVQDSWR